MRVRFSFLRAPSPATAVAIVALVVAASGGAIAKDKLDKDEVTNLAVTGGPILSEDPSDGPVSIALSPNTFTQKAGEALLATAYIDVGGTLPEDATCDLYVGVQGNSTTTRGWGFGIIDDLFELAQRGDPGDRTGSAALPAPDTDEELELTADVLELIPPDENGDPAEDTGQCDTNQFEVEIVVTLTSLRD